MRLIDTHAHLFLKEFEPDIERVVANAEEMGVVRVLLPNIDENSVADLKRCVAKFPNMFFPMMGLHPTSISDEFRKQMDIIYGELKSGEYIAVGEVGIDLYWDKSPINLKRQRELFEEQLRWSIELDLPLSIHFRAATEEVIRSIKRVGESALRGVFHSFGGDVDELNAILQLKNFMIGVNGVATFKNSGLDKTLSRCPTGRVVTETDSPYLAPVPFRAKRNQSAYISFIVEKLSEIWGIEKNKLAEITTRNGEEMFGAMG